MKRKIILITYIQLVVVFTLSAQQLSYTDAQRVAQTACFSSNNDENETTSSQMANFDNKMKHPITIGSSSNSVQMTSGTSKALHAEEISIIGGFEVPLGTTLTLVTHECPNY